MFGAIIYQRNSCQVLSLVILIAYRFIKQMCVLRVYKLYVYDY